MYQKTGFTILLLASAAFISHGQQPKMMLRVGHTAEVRTAYYSPDNRHILTASEDGSAKIWDAKTGDVLADLNGSTYPLISATYSGDGKKIMTLPEEGKIIVWDAANGNSLFTVSTFFGGFSAAAFSHDSRKIATAEGEGKVTIHDAQSGNLLATLEDQVADIDNICFSYDDSKLFTPSENNAATIWNTTTGKAVVTLKGHTRKVTYGAFSPKGNLIITLAKDHTARLWDASTGATLREWKDDYHDFDEARFSKDNINLLLISKHGASLICNLKTGAVIANLNRNVHEVHSACLSPDGKRAAIAFSTFDAIIIDIESNTVITHLKGHKQSINAINYSPDGRQILTASKDKSAIVWNAQTGAVSLTLNGGTKSGTDEDDEPVPQNYPHQRPDALSTAANGKSESHTPAATQPGIHQVAKTAFTEDGSLLYVYNKDNSRHVFEVNTGMLTRYTAICDKATATAAYSGNKRTAILVNEDGSVQVLDVDADRQLVRLNDIHHPSAASLNYDGTMAATANIGEGIKLWQIPSGKILKTINTGSGIGFSVSFSPDGKRIVGGSLGLIRAYIWDVASGKLVDSLSSNSLIKSFLSGQTGLNREISENGQVCSAAYTSDGRLIVATNMLCNCVDIFTASDGRFQRTLKGTPWENFTTATSGNRILSVEQDQYLKLWDITAGKEICKILAVDSLDFLTQLPNGYYRATQPAARLLYYTTPDLGVITFEQLDIKYNRPDKVLEAMGCTDVALIQSYRKAYQKRIQKLGIDTASFQDGYSLPGADIENRSEITYEQNKGTLELRIKGVDPKFSLDRFNAWVNESPLFGSRGISLRGRRKNSFDTTIIIDLSAGKNIIETSVINSNGIESYRKPLTVNYTPALPVRENVWFIGIGIDSFAEAGYELKWSTTDIINLALAFQGKYGSQYHQRLLLNNKVTLQTVIALRRWLQDSTGINDKVIIAYSGHGMLSRDYDYFLSTYNVSFTQPDKNGLPYEALEGLLDGIPARKKLLLIDACHSGEVDKEELKRYDEIKGMLASNVTRGIPKVSYGYAGSHLGMKNSFELMQQLFINVGRSTGATVISAAGGTQYALEKASLKDGVFTYSILEKLHSGGNVTVTELRNYVGKRVQELTGGMQVPTTRNEAKNADWELW